MSYKRSKYFTTSNKRKIKYLYIKKKSPIAIVFFHGFMSDMVGAKPTAIQKFCKKHVIIITYIVFPLEKGIRKIGKLVEIYCYFTVLPSHIFTKAHNLNCGTRQLRFLFLKRT